LWLYEIRQTLSRGTSIEPVKSTELKFLNFDDSNEAILSRDL
jgi:hypothetical protein